MDFVTADQMRQAIKNNDECIKNEYERMINMEVGDIILDMRVKNILGIRECKLPDYTSFKAREKLIELGYIIKNNKVFW